MRNTAFAGSDGAGTTDGGAGGVVMQPAMDATSTAASSRWKGEPMEWLLLEALVALALAVFIVWFTMGGRRKNPPRAPKDTNEGDGEAGG
ncbi:MAG TPA: hypothetical protein VH704_09065 [Casimicrobiaceae bacterium]|jgi:hypothetical protein|nr:hypothetical protein [Casimicrobiaceae bacterium]